MKECGLLSPASISALDRRSVPLTKANFNRGIRGSRPGASTCSPHPNFIPHTTVKVRTMTLPLSG
eukprot:scaffold16_cov190-Alexandrium_tamarense.AAC.21